MEEGERNEKSWIGIWAAWRGFPGRMEMWKDAEVDSDMVNLAHMFCGVKGEKERNS